MSLFNLTIEYLESRDLARLTGICPVEGCGLPAVARHGDDNAPVPQVQQMAKPIRINGCEDFPCPLGKSWTVEKAENRIRSAYPSLTGGYIVNYGVSTDYSDVIEQNGYYEFVNFQIAQLSPPQTDPIIDATGVGESTATPEEIPSTSYVTPIWLEEVQLIPGEFGAVPSEETKGSVSKARRYAAKIEELRATHHRKRNERYYCFVDRENEINMFRIYFTRRSTHSTFPIFQCPLHQLFLRDCYVHFRLCNNDMQAFGEFLFDNGNSPPPTGLPWPPPPLGQLYCHNDPELQTFRNTL